MNRWIWIHEEKLGNIRYSAGEPTEINEFALVNK